MPSEGEGHTFESYRCAIFSYFTADIGRPLPFPSRFDEQVQRKADHFELLLGLLKILAHAPEESSADVELWRRRADAAIAKAEAILAGENDPIQGAVS
ncbi:hypothetical protein [Bradyrhizobium cytisi]|uniref:hypothetical protein n=1 Tax=Bradyrhizobium cytisi TaxID=515489 RepID=UPI003D31EF1A